MEAQDNGNLEKNTQILETDKRTPEWSEFSRKTCVRKGIPGRGNCMDKGMVVGVTYNSPELRTAGV